MKNVLDLLKGTREIDPAPEVVKGTVRELDMSELGMVSGGLPLAGTTIINTSSKSGGGNDDCIDGGPMDCI